MAVFRYAGGKARKAGALAGKVAKLRNGAIATYREPFMGGGNVLLALLQQHVGIGRVWLNDADPGIAAFWTAVILSFELLTSKIRRFRPSVPAFYEFRDYFRAAHEVPTTAEDVAELGFRKLAVHRLSSRGLGAMAHGPLGGKHQRRGREVESRWNADRICREIERAHALLSEVEIVGGRCTSLDFEQVIGDDRETSVLFLDPPYFTAGPQIYLHAFQLQDHQRLARLLQRSNHEFVLTYDDHPTIRELYSWADIERVEVTYSLGGPRRASELVITRGEGSRVDAAENLATPNRDVRSLPDCCTAA